MITHKSSRRREPGLLDDFALQILRCAQHDKTPGCHAERSEESLADLWGITRIGLHQANVAQFIEDMYNTKRLHFSPGYAPPIEFEV